MSGRLKTYCFWLDDELLVINDYLLMLVQFRGRTITACYDVRQDAKVLLEVLQVRFTLFVLILLVIVSSSVRDFDDG